MPKSQVRMGQVVGLFGPGAMMDLPERSVLIMGLQDWEAFGKDAFKTIEEPRLAQLLERRLGDAADKRLANGKPLRFRTPPIDAGDPRRASPAIKAKVFPEWFACDAVEGDTSNRRRIVRLGDLDPPRLLEYIDDKKRRRVSPLRFVCGCEKGHLQDIEWRRVVHAGRSDEEGGGRACRQAMWLVDAGTSADPRDTQVVCDCGARLSLEELFQQSRLGTCQGKRPWIGPDDPAGCDAPKGLRLLTRSATNTYFPQIVRVISLPESNDALDRALDAVWSEIKSSASAGEVTMARRFNQAIAANLEGFGDAAVFARIEARKAAPAPSSPQAAQNPRIAEYQVLACGRPVIGENHPKALLHAETLDRSVWDRERAPLLRGIASLVAVHRLREVACLYGFTRFEPAPLADDGIEDVGLAVNGAPLADDTDWLPAIEQFGEGFFLRFDPLALAAWIARPEIADRRRTLMEGVTTWTKARKDRGASAAVPKEGESLEFVMAHSLAHALITEVAIDCGYPASSLKERLYLMPSMPGQPPDCGILIYTASAGNQGTLGGLVEVTRRFPAVLKSALDRLALCSGDPICADHEPAHAAEDRALHGAACHGCLLIAETSCEQRNVFLDRSLLVPTLAVSGCAYFPSDAPLV
ncbi:DUF1998 domain-containing protein [Pseudoxanthobacter sp. M-2]|uniref:DrmB family protein n=1 Tax=Pseudoxanthobacter sp. M-2 TaxID=3078754 RepID=UPI0038FCB7BA